MKNFTLLISLLFFTIVAIGSTDISNSTIPSSINHKLDKTIQKYRASSISTIEAEDNFEMLNFYSRFKELEINTNKQNTLKSSSEKQQKMDSLLVERWNEDTGILELSQLERWTWYEDGLGKSWELYDYDPNTEKWLANDKEEYEWDDQGNKILHVDFDPDTINGGWLLNGQEIYTFNSSGNEISYLLQFLNQETQEWENNRLSTTTYDNEGNIILVMTTVWDNESQSWVNSSKEVSTYNEDLVQVSSQFFTWEETDWISFIYGGYTFDEYGFIDRWEVIMDAYQMHSLVEYINDSTGNVLQKTTSQWDYTSSAYKYTQKDDYVFSEEGNNTLWTQWIWKTETDDWALSMKINYQYDENGFLVYRDRFNQDHDLKVWVADWKNNYVNNADGNITLKTSMLWDTTSSDWINNYQNHIDYNDQKQQSYIDLYNWDTRLQEWVGSTKEIETYDNSGNYLMHTKQNYDTINNQWMDEFSDEYRYDLSIEFSAIAYPPNSWPFGHLSNLYYFKQYSNAMLQKVYSELKNDQIEITEIYTFYYSKNALLASNKINQSNIRIFPNPATEALTIEFNENIESLVIYNMLGETVFMESNLENSNTVKVNVANFNKGLYLIQTQYKGQINIAKVFVE